MKCRIELVRSTSLLKRAAFLGALFFIVCSASSGQSAEEIIGDFEVTTDGWTQYPGSADTLLQATTGATGGTTYALQVARTGSGFWAIQKQVEDIPLRNIFLRTTSIQMDLTFDRSLFAPNNPPPTGQGGFANIEFAFNHAWNGFSYHQRKPDGDNMNPGDPGASINTGNLAQPEVVTHTISFDLTSDARGWLTYMNGMRNYYATTTTGVNNNLQLNIAVNYDSGFTSGSFIFDRIRFIYYPLSRGDFTISDGVTNADIQGMISALQNPDAYKMTHFVTDTDLLTLGDYNNSGTLTADDIPGLLTQLTDGIANPPGSGSIAAVPEPASLVLLGLALPALLVAARRRRVAT